MLIAALSGQELAAFSYAPVEYWVLGVYPYDFF
jgi:hypothetical protein